MGEFYNEKEKRQNVRRVLWQWGDTMRRCSRKQREIDDILTMIDDMRELTGRSIDGMPRATTTTQPTERAAMNVIEAYDEAVKTINESIEQATGLKRCIDELADLLPPDQQKVLELRYIDQKSWVVTAHKMNYSQAQVERIENAAIDKLSGCMTIYSLEEEA